MNQKLLGYDILNDILTFDIDQFPIFKIFSNHFKRKMINTDPI